MQTATSVKLIEITRPSDWHHHFRDGTEWLQVTAPLCFSQFEYAVAMPNLATPVQTLEHAARYHNSIIGHANHPDAKPMMTYYMNTDLPVDEIFKAADVDYMLAVKYYPQGVTTNSAGGLATYEQVRAQLSAMEDIGMPLLVHGEQPGQGFSVFDRESAFIESGQIRKIQEEFPSLKITMEHISTSKTAAYLWDVCRINKSARLAATITPHHLTCTVDSLFTGCGIRPSMYCCPILKYWDDRDALQELAMSGLANVFYGSDNAPHTDSTKFQDGGKPGIFNIHCGLNLVIDLFIMNGQLDRLDGFVSTHGCDWYGKRRPASTVSIYLNDASVHSVVPDKVPMPIYQKSKFVGNEYITPMNAGQKIKYKLITS